MSEVSGVQVAQPNTRIIEIDVNNKSIELPAYFLSITNSKDVTALLEAIQYLQSESQYPLPNLGGIRVELQNAHEYLVKHLDDHLLPHEQRSLNGEKATMNLYDVFDSLERLLLIDPNTDRLFYQQYREGFSNLDGLPSEIKQTVNRYSDKKDKSIKSQTGAYKHLRSLDDDQFRDISESVLAYQFQLGSDFYLQPYFPIDKHSIGKGFGKDNWSDWDRKLPANLRLWQISDEIADSDSRRNVDAVIPLKKGVYADPDLHENGRNTPQLWENIMDAYASLNCDRYFVKATNAEFDPSKVDKNICEGLVRFIKIFREKYTDKPVIFLGLDKLSYVLMAFGLDGYSQPMYNNPFQASIGGFSADQRPDPSKINRNKEFLVPRSGGRIKFNQLETLGCAGPFCEPFSGTDPETIPIRKQDNLARKHWLWYKDAEIEQLKQAIRQDHVRPALQNFYSDSDWEKNYIKFL